MNTTTTTISTTTLTVIKAINGAIKKSPNGVSFISINGYTNSFGEVSNNLVNIGASYENAKNKDIETLKNADILTIQTVSDKITLEKARQELIASLIKPNENRSNGQIDAYTPICKGLKVHNETGEIYVYGYGENKKIIVEGTYPKVNSRALTIAKNELKKALNLRTNKYKNFKVTNISNMKLNGDILEF